MGPRYNYSECLNSVNEGGRGRERGRREGGRKSIWVYMCMLTMPHSVNEGGRGRERGRREGGRKSIWVFYSIPHSVNEGGR